MTTMMKPWDSKFMTAETAKQLGNQRAHEYVAFKDLKPDFQAYAVRAYPHKNVGAKYNFRDEHYYYPVKKDGSLTHGQRVLAIPYDLIKDNEYMASLGYKVKPGWVEKEEKVMGQGVPARAVEVVQAFMAREDYEPRVSEAVLVTKRRLGEASEPVIAALGVFLLSKGTREQLAGNDPKAVMQAFKSIGINV